MTSSELFILSKPVDYTDFSAVSTKALNTADETDEKDEKYRSHIRWLNNGSIKVILGASQRKMQKLRKIPGAYSIIDENRTEIPGDCLTAICFTPLLRSAAPKAIRKLQPYNDSKTQHPI